MSYISPSPTFDPAHHLYVTSPILVWGYCRIPSVAWRHRCVGEFSDEKCPTPPKLPLNTRHSFNPTIEEVFGLPILSRVRDPASVYFRKESRTMLQCFSVTYDMHRTSVACDGVRPSPVDHAQL